MLPSDHFVRFYNEVFKYLDKLGPEHLEKYWQEISRHQERHCLELFKNKGLQGMYDYWEHIRIEENCDLEMKLFDDHIEMHMKKCPSLSKILDNDADASEKYCLHCPGWIKPLLEKAGFHCVYDIIAPRLPQCRMYIYKKQADAIKKEQELSLI